MLLYSWSLSILGPLGFVCVNAVVLSWISWRTSPWIVLCLPCLLVAIAMPSKEILLAPLMLVGWWALGRKRYLSLTLTCGLTFLVRDGAGIAICVWIIGSLVAARLHVRGFFIVVAALVSGLVIHVSLDHLSDKFFLIDRNVTAFGSIDSPVSASAFSIFGYAVRWFASLTALAFRPAPPVDAEGNVPLLAVAYWMCGLTVLVTAQDSLRYLLGRHAGRSDQSQQDGQDAALALWLAVAVFAVNPIVQPRYIIPFVIPYVAWMLAQRSVWCVLRMYAVLATVSLWVILAQWLIGLPGVDHWQQGPEWPLLEGFD